MHPSTTTMKSTKPHLVRNLPCTVIPTKFTKPDHPRILAYVRNLRNLRSTKTRLVGLSDAMRASQRLQVVVRVPVRVVDDHRVGRGQVDALPASVQAEKSREIRSGQKTDKKRSKIRERMGQELRSTPNKEKRMGQELRSTPNQEKTCKREAA